MKQCPHRWGSPSYDSNGADWDELNRESFRCGKVFLGHSPRAIALELAKFVIISMISSIALVMCRHMPTSNGIFVAFTSSARAANVYENFIEHSKWAYQSDFQKTRPRWFTQRTHKHTHTHVYWHNHRSFIQAFGVRSFRPFDTNQTNELNSNSIKWIKRKRYKNSIRQAFGGELMGVAERNIHFMTAFFSPNWK